MRSLTEGIKMQMTITEGLAEIKLINDKIAKKQTFVLDNLARYNHTPDPLAAKGGSTVALSAEVQSIADLETRLMKIRVAIMLANLTNFAECNGQNLSLYEWLVWKREVAKQRSRLYEYIYSKTKEKMDRHNMQPQWLKNEDGQNALVELLPSLPYMEYATAFSEVNETLNKLDGVLSLKNATVLIELP